VSRAGTRGSELLTFLQREYSASGLESLPIGSVLLTLLTNRPGDKVSIKLYNNVFIKKKCWVYKYHYIFIKFNLLLKNVTRVYAIFVFKKMYTFN
jgi:hypothetical protein